MFKKKKNAGCCMVLARMLTHEIISYPFHVGTQETSLGSLYVLLTVHLGND